MAVLWFLAVGGLVALAAGLLLDGVLELGPLSGDGGGVFSLPVLGGFCAVLGFTSLIAISAGLATGVAVLIGLVAGIAAAWVAVRAMRALRDDGTEGATSREQRVGSTAAVVSDIPRDGYGEVSVVLAGTASKLSARSDGHAIPRGTEVLVLTLLSDNAVLVREI